MYSSCRSAQRSPSSREIAWFWPSGSSVTMNVERLERLTTSVWTFRFPYRVGRAFGIRAASSLTVCGSGFSTTLAASGSRKSILATRESLSGLRGGQAVLQNGRCAVGFARRAQGPRHRAATQDPCLAVADRRRRGGRAAALDGLPQRDASVEAPHRALGRC